MPSNRAQAAYKHRHLDGTPNIEVQREFERLYKKTESLHETVKTISASVSNPSQPSSPVAEPYIEKCASYEYVEHSPYTVSGGVETPPTIYELSNRQPQYNDFMSYPIPNNGDGWIPMKADTKIFDSLETVNILASTPYEHPSSGTQSREQFIFYPPVTGVYRIEAGVYIKGLGGHPSSATLPKPYDAIDKGMLVLEKDNYSNMIKGYHNLLVEDVGSGLVSVDRAYDILDYRGPINETDSTRNMTLLDSNGNFMIPTTAYSNPTYSSGASYGCVIGMLYNREIKLQGTTYVFLKEGEGIRIWYKIYSRRLALDSGGQFYYDIYAGRSGANSTTYPSDSIFLIEDRYEKVDIKLVRAEDMTITKSSILNIVSKF